MNPKTLRSTLILFVFCSLLFQSAQAQFFHRLHAYMLGTELKTGEYQDLACMDVVSSSGVNVVAIGTASGTPEYGTITYNHMRGAQIMVQNFKNAASGTNDIRGVAVSETQNNEVIAAFYDASDNATDVWRLRIDGSVVWKTRLPDFQVRDIDVDYSPNFPTNDGVWLVGNSATGHLAIEGMDGNGNQVFGNQYSLTAASITILNSIGYELEYDSFNDHIVVIGTGYTPLETMIHVRTDIFGNYIHGTVYNEPFLGYDGKALIADPLINGSFIVDFSYDNAPNRLPGRGEIDATGNVVWMNAYLPSPFFSGADFISHAIGTDGTKILGCGAYTDNNSAQNRAYSLATDPVGGTAFLNEYTNFTNYPAVKSGLFGIDYNNLNNDQYMAGTLITTATSGNWPEGSNPESFYMMRGHNQGNTECYHWEIPGIQPLDPQIHELNNTTTSMPVQDDCPLSIQTGLPMQANQCTFASKMAQTETLTEDGTIQLVHSSNGDNYLEITGEATGTGSIQIVDLQGKILSESVSQSGKNRLDQANLSAGVYFVRFVVPGIGSGVKKMVIR